MKKTTLLLVFIMTCNLVLAQNYFMKFHGIVGETKDQYHKGWSDVLALNYELNVEDISSSRNRGHFYSAISIVKKIDKSSPKIMEACATGKVIPVVLIEVSISGKVIYKYDLRNVQLTNYSIEGAKSDIPQEKYTLEHEEIKVTYFMFDNSGKPQGQIDTKMNLKLNRIE